MTKIKLSILLILVVTLSLAIAAPVGAAPSVGEDYTFDVEWTDTQVCGFPVTIRAVGGGTVHTFFELDGVTPKRGCVLKW